MATDRSFQAKNAQARERLTALAGRLEEADLQRPVGHGWTVAATLVHLAFWDLRAIVLMDRYQKAGVTPSATFAAEDVWLAGDVDVVNDTVHALAQAIPPRAAARLAIDAAERVDRRIEALPDRLLDAVAAAADPPFNLARHTHRTEHLDEIEGALR